MHRDQVDDVLVRPVQVEEDHPRPRPEHKSGFAPSPFERTAGEWEVLEKPERGCDPSPGVTRKTKSLDRDINVVPRSRSDDYPRHSGQLVERDALRPMRLLDALLGPLPRARSSVQDCRDRARLGVGCLQRAGEQRPRQRSFLDVRALGHQRELPGMLLVEHNVDAGLAGGHTATLHTSTHNVLWFMAQAGRQLSFAAEPIDRILRAFGP